MARGCRVPCEKDGVTPEKSSHPLLPSEKDLARLIAEGSLACNDSYTVFQGIACIHLGSSMPKPLLLYYAH
eukprot:706924-Amphidinium_carterae.2